MALTLIVLATPAGAVVFNMGGPGGAAGVDMSTTSGLYASGRDEVPTLIAQLGAIAPGGDVFEDLGVPSISPEGDVVFGAETVGQDDRPRWDIYRANVGAPGNLRIVRVLDGASMDDGCRPEVQSRSVSSRGRQWGGCFSGSRGLGEGRGFPLRKWAPELRSATRRSHRARSYR